MKIGVKIYTKNYELVPRYIEHADFIEVLIEPEMDYKILKDYDTEYIIHVPHHKFGFNPADKKSWIISKKILEESKSAADFLDAKKMIMHVGHFGNDDCNENNIIEFIEDHKDDRILLENLPKKTKYLEYPFALPGEVKRIADKLKLGICLDFSHAVCAAASLKTDFRDIIKEINQLKPKHYHISDGLISNDTDFDLHFFKGDYPLEEFKKLIPQNGEVTIETYHDDFDKKVKEIEFMRT